MSIMWPNESDPVPEAELTQKAFAHARQRLADVIRGMYHPDPPTAYARLLPALRLDGDKKPALRVRHIDETKPGQLREEFWPLREGAASLLANDGPDQRYVREVSHAAHVPTQEEIAAAHAESKKRELQYAWSESAPLVRELLKLADVADAGHQKLFLALARVFSMKPSDFIGTAGEPAKAAAAFFGIQPVNTNGEA